MNLTGGMELHDSAGSGAFDYGNCAGGFLSATIAVDQTVTDVGG